MARYFLFFLLVVAVMSAGCTTKSSASPTARSGLMMTAEEATRAYEEALRQTLSPFWQHTDEVGIKDQLLMLRVPKEFLDLHFRLVAAFELLEQGRQENDDSKVERGRARLAEIELEYPWISDF